MAFRVWQRIKGSEKLIDILQKLYSHTTTALKETPYDLFEILLGVRQGDPAPQMLFKLYIDNVMRIFKAACDAKGIEFPRLIYQIPEAATEKKQTMGGFCLFDWIGCADDLVLVFKDLRNMQAELNELNTTFERFSLKINKSKSKTMVLCYNDKLEYPRNIVKVEGKDVEM